MAILNTFPAEPLPDFPSSIAPSYQVTDVEYGDGYRLSRPAGINSRTDTVRLVWTQLHRAEVEVLEDFLEAHAPATPFYCSPLAGRQSAYTCREWTKDQTNGGYFAMTATLVQFHGGV